MLQIFEIKSNFEHKLISIVKQVVSFFFFFPKQNQIRKVIIEMARVIYHTETFQS